MNHAQASHVPRLRVEVLLGPFLTNDEVACEHINVQLVCARSTSNGIPQNLQAANIRNFCGLFCIFSSPYRGNYVIFFVAVTLAALKQPLNRNAECLGDIR